MASHKIDLIIDGKKIQSQGQDIKIKIDDKNIFDTRFPSNKEESDLVDFPLETVKSFLKSSNSVFSHIDRYRLVTSLTESPKSFTEIKTMLNAKSPTTNFHLKTLINGMIIYKNENGRYALTILGESVLDYFSKFLEEATKVYDEIMVNE